jgi:NAD(P)-dependent dehydrogenase (short-subunit alcohol dehydrogenase family)
MNLKGKTAVITGASGSLGSVIALALGQAGCNCLCHYFNNKQTAEQVAAQIRTLGPNALAVRVDLTSENEIKQLFDHAAELGCPQLLVNCAAVFEKSPLEQASFEQAREILNINLTAAIITSKYFAKSVKKNFNIENKPACGELAEPAGKIINIADIGGIRPWANYVFYCASKAGLIGATKSLAKELAPAICVNAVAPGIITWPDDFDDAEKQKQLSLIPLKRIAKPQEIACAVISLLENDYITGQVLCVDGGRSI